MNEWGSDFNISEGTSLNSPTLLAECQLCPMGQVLPPPTWAFQPASQGRGQGVLSVEKATGRAELIMDCSVTATAVNANGMLFKKKKSNLLGFFVSSLHTKFYLMPTPGSSWERAQPQGQCCLSPFQGPLWFTGPNLCLPSTSDTALPHHQPQRKPVLAWGPGKTHRKHRSC